MHQEGGTFLQCALQRCNTIGSQVASQQVKCKRGKEGTEQIRSAHTQFKPELSEEGEVVCLRDFQRHLHRPQGQLKVRQATRKRSPTGRLKERWSSLLHSTLEWRRGIDPLHSESDGKQELQNQMIDWQEIRRNHCRSRANSNWRPRHSGLELPLVPTCNSNSAHRSHRSNKWPLMHLTPEYNTSPSAASRKPERCRTAWSGKVSDATRLPYDDATHRL